MSQQMMYALRGVKCTFVMQFKSSDPSNPIRKRVVYFEHTVGSTGWRGVRNEAALIVAKEFNYPEVAMAAYCGRSACIALEARFDTWPECQAAIAMQKRARAFFYSVRIPSPVCDPEPDYDFKFRCAKRALRTLENVYEQIEADQKKAKEDVLVEESEDEERPLPHGVRRAEDSSEEEDSEEED